MFVGVGHLDAGTIGDKRHLLFAAEVVFVHSKGEAQIRGIALVGLEEHEVVVELWVHGVKVGKHMQEVVVASEER